MKTLQLLFLSLLLPLAFHAQNSLTGLWTGTLDNDSNTIRKEQTFEIALTQYKEKVYGYSRMNFIVNDTLYYIVKRVKGVIENDICEVKDDYIVKHNFPKQPEKGVKLITTFRRNQKDSVWRLDGDWKTTETKRHRYYSISGNISLKAEPDLEKSRLFPHLEELSLANDVAFYKDSKKTNPATQTATAPPLTGKEAGSLAKNNDQKQVSQVDVSKAMTGKTNNPSASLASNEPAASSSDYQHAINKKEEDAGEAFTANTVIKKSDLPASTVPVAGKKEVSAATSKPEVRYQEPALKRDDPETATLTEPAGTGIKKSDLVTTVKTSEEKKMGTGIAPGMSVKAPAAATFVQERKTVASQVVFFKTDSLELALYDNGEIDGDTVSVLLNGEVLLARQGLKASAIKKTVYIQSGEDEITLVLYAENLGKYPPNTGLLVVRDGEEKYQIRFSADLQQNASVVFRRKK